MLTRVRRARWLGLLAVAAALTLTLAACARRQPAPETAKELNIFNWTEYMPDSILRDFEKEFGVRINYDTYSSNEELLAKIQAGATGYDLIVPSDYMVAAMISMGLLEPINLDNIPNFQHIGDNFKNPAYDPGNRYSVPYMWGTTSLAYNAKYVTEPVTSWAVLWDPKYKGKIVVVDDARAVIGMVLRKLGYSANTTDPEILAKAKDELKKLTPSILAYDSDSPKTLLISEEAWLGLVWNGEAVLAMQENPSIKYVIPQEGASIWVDNMAIPKGAPHKELAEQFINYLYRPEVSATLAREFPYGTPNLAAIPLLPEEIRNNPAAYPPQEDVARTELLEDLGEATVLFDEIWTEVKTGN